MIVAPAAVFDERLDLELFDSRIFPSGVSVLLYRRPGR